MRDTDGNEIESAKSNTASAAPADNIRAVLSHTPVTSGRVGQSISISATATDNIGIASVKLYYRAAGYFVLHLIEVAELHGRFSLRRIVILSGLWLLLACTAGAATYGADTVLPGIGSGVSVLSYSAGEALKGAYAINPNAADGVKVACASASSSPKDGELLRLSVSSEMALNEKDLALSIDLFAGEGGERLPYTINGKAPADNGGGSGSKSSGDESASGGKSSGGGSGSTSTSGGGSSGSAGNGSTSAGSATSGKTGGSTNFTGNTSAQTVDNSTENAVSINKKAEENSAAHGSVTINSEKASLQKQYARLALFPSPGSAVKELIYGLSVNIGLM